MRGRDSMYVKTDIEQLIPDRITLLNMAKGGGLVRVMILANKYSLLMHSYRPIHTFQIAEKHGWMKAVEYETICCFGGL